MSSAISDLVDLHAPETQAAEPSQADLVHTIAADALSASGVVTVEGVRRAGKTAVAELVAVQLQGRGRLVVLVEGPLSRLPVHHVTPARITETLLRAAGISGGDDDLPPDVLLATLLVQPGLRDLVLLVDDADALPPATWRFLDLMMGLAEFGKARLRLVLFGVPGRWPDPATLPRLRSGLMAPRVITPLVSRGTAHPGLPLVRVDSGLAQPDVSRRVSRMLPWPALMTGGAVLACAAGLAIVAGQRPRNPAEGPPAAVASADAVAPAPSAPAAPIEPARTLPSPPAPVLVGTASGKVIPGASALGVVLAQAETLAAQPRSLAPAVAATYFARPGESPHPAPDSLSPVRGLLLVARPGDTLAALYAEVYRGRPAPPFADVSAANPAPVRPGALVVFPAPPGGWSKP